MSRELVRRIAFTIGALLLFRLGTQIPIAGLDVSRLSSLPDFNARLSLFSLGLIPYLTAAIFLAFAAPSSSVVSISPELMI